MERIDNGKLNHVFMNGIASAPQEVTKRTSFVSLTMVYTVKLENNMLASVMFLTSSFLGNGAMVGNESCLHWICVWDLDRFEIRLC